MQEFKIWGGCLWILIYTFSESTSWKNFENFFRKRKEKTSIKNICTLKSGYGVYGFELILFRKVQVEKTFEIFLEKEKRKILQYGFCLIKTLHYIVQCFIDILSLPLKNIVRQISLSISKKYLQIFDKFFVRFAPVVPNATNDWINK